MTNLNKLFENLTYSLLHLSKVDKERVANAVLEAYELGRKDAEEEMAGFIMKNFYNEKTCKKINKFLNK